MEIWKLKKKGWVKEPYVTFPGSEPLTKLMVEHQRLRPDHNWVVFSKDEQNLLRQTARQFLIEDNMVERWFLDFLIGNYLKERFAPAPSVTYVGADPNKAIGLEKEFYLAIEFHRP